MIILYPNVHYSFSSLVFTVIFLRLIRVSNASSSCDQLQEYQEKQILLFFIANRRYFQIFFNPSKKIFQQLFQFTLRFGNSKPKTKQLSVKPYLHEHYFGKFFSMSTKIGFFFFITLYTEIIILLLGNVHRNCKKKSKIN